MLRNLGYNILDLGSKNGRICNVYITKLSTFAPQIINCNQVL